jgi:hypothetical protein
MKLGLRLFALQETFVLHNTGITVWTNTMEDARSWYYKNKIWN